jgi:hypothetical protein
MDEVPSKLPQLFYFKFYVVYLREGTKCATAQPKKTFRLQDRKQEQEQQSNH